MAVDIILPSGFSEDRNCFLLSLLKLTANRSLIMLQIFLRYLEIKIILQRQRYPQKKWDDNVMRKYSNSYLWLDHFFPFFLCVTSLQWTLLLSCSQHYNTVTSNLFHWLLLQWGQTIDDTVIHFLPCSKCPPCLASVDTILIFFIIFSLLNSLMIFFNLYTSICCSF